MRRGEIWWVDFAPTVGHEIEKLRPAVIINQDGIGKLDLCVVVPLTEWQTGFSQNPWMVRIIPSYRNGLDKAVAADAFQIKSVAKERMKDKKGQIDPQDMAEILAAVVLVIGHQCDP